MLQNPHVFARFWQGAQSLAPATQNDIWTSKNVPDPSLFCTFDLEMCFAPQRRALFRHHNFQKWSEPGVLCAFWLGNVLRATPACNFSSHMWPAGSAPAALASLLFDPPEPQVIGKTQCFATFLPFRAPGSSFFRDFLFLSLLLLFSSLLWLFPSLLFICPYCQKFDLWFQNFLRSTHINPFHSISVRINLYQPISTISIHIIPYQSVSIHINPFHSISLRTNPYQLISTHFTPNHSITILINPYQPISLHITPYQSISTHINPFHSKSLHNNPYQSISTHYTPHHSVSIHINHFQSVSTHINPFHSKSLRINPYQPISIHINRLITRGPNLCLIWRKPIAEVKLLSAREALNLKARAAKGVGYLFVTPTMAGKQPNSRGDMIGTWLGYILEYIAVRYII